MLVVESFFVCFGYEIVLGVVFGEDLDVGFDVEVVVCWVGVDLFLDDLVLFDGVQVFVDFVDVFEVLC